MNNTTKKIPVLFVMFNRPQVAAESFQAIKRYKPERLYLAADGHRPDKEGEREICEKTRSLILQEIDWDCEVKKLFRNENVGCGRGLSEAITWMFETEEYGAIIEDDCLVSDDYFLFCEELLPKYSDDDRVAQINCFTAGYKREFAHTYYFTGYPEIWGWATWRRAWVNYDFEMKEWKRIRRRIFTRFQPLEACIHYLLWKKEYDTFQKKQKPNVWDSQWSIYIFMQNKVCIEPYISLVRSLGFGAPSTNNSGMDTDNPLAKVEHGALVLPLVHPDAVEWDKKREKSRSNYYCKYYVRLLFRKILRDFQRIFGGIKS